VVTMGLKAALEFIRAVRSGGLQPSGPDASPRRALEALGPAVSTPELVEVGRAWGFEFTAAELHAAFARDWEMRALVYGDRLTFDVTTLTAGPEEPTA
jgi:hypothetical protein